MSLREQILDLKVQTLMKEESKFVFPEFMRLLRKSLGFTRRSVADVLGVSESKMYYLEDGRYRSRGPDHEFIVTLAHFYGIEGNFAIEKFLNYQQKTSNESYS